MTACTTYPWHALCAEVSKLKIHREGPRAEGQLQDLENIQVPVETSELATVLLHPEVTGLNFKETVVRAIGFEPMTPAV